MLLGSAKYVNFEFIISLGQSRTGVLSMWVFASLCKELVRRSRMQNGSLIYYAHELILLTRGVKAHLWTQWAAVRIYLSLMMLPAQKGLRLLVLANPT